MKKLKDLFWNFINVVVGAIAVFVGVLFVVFQILVSVGIPALLVYILIKVAVYLMEHT